MKRSFLFMSIVVSIGLSACSRDEEPEAKVYQQQPPTQPVQQQPVYVEQQGSNGTDVLLGMAAGAAVGSMLANNSRPTEVHHYHERTVVTQPTQRSSYTSFSNNKPSQSVAPVKSTSPSPKSPYKPVTQTYTASTAPTKSTSYSSTSKSYGSSLSSGSSSSYKTSSSSYKPSTSYSSSSSYKPSSSSYSSSSSYRSSSTSFSSSRR